MATSGVRVTAAASSSTASTSAPCRPTWPTGCCPSTWTLITEQYRLTEEKFWPAWQDAHPAILGALLDLAAAVLGCFRSVELERKPRMADFARILAAVDAELGTQALERYVRRGADLAAEGLSGDSFAVAIQAVITAGGFNGTSAQLLEFVTPDGDSAKPPKDWPKDGRAVTGACAASPRRSASSAGRSASTGTATGS